MIVSTHIDFTISGDKLAQGEIEKDFGVTFSKVRRENEVTKSTSATISSESEKYTQDVYEIYRLAVLSTKLTENAERYGIDESSFHLYFYYAAQCNLSFDPKVLSALSKLESVNISCIKLFDMYKTEQVSDDQELVKFYSGGKLEKEVTLRNELIK